jgi:anti-sigma factor RsiW
MKKACEHTKELIADMVNGMADVSEREAIESHIAACRDCRAYRHALEGEDRLLRDYFGGFEGAVDRGPKQVAVALEHLHIGGWRRLSDILWDFAGSSLSRHAVAAALIVVVTAYFVITLSWITQITECIQQSM